MQDYIKVLNTSALIIRAYHKLINQYLFYQQNINL